MSERERFAADVEKIHEAFLYVAPVHASVVRDAEVALGRVARLARNTFKWADEIDANWECGGNDWWSALLEIRSYRDEQSAAAPGDRGEA